MANSASIALALDHVSFGNWNQIAGPETPFGTEGFIIIGEWETLGIPGYATVSPGTHSAFSYADHTANIEDICHHDSTTDRIQSIWYDPVSFDISITVTGRHRVRFYVVDYDNQGRTGHVDMIDGTDGTTVRATQVASGYTNAGVWVSFDISGHIIARFVRTTGDNIDIAAIMFDPAPPAAGPPKFLPETLALSPLTGIH